MLNKKIKELREAKGLYQRQVAAYLDVDTAYICKMEHGDKPISRSNLQKLATLFDVPESELVTIWLSDKIVELVKEEPVCEDSLKLSINRMNKMHMEIN